MRIGSAIVMTPGPCEVCGKSATMVLRRTTRAGVPATARSCNDHEQEVTDLLSNATAEQLASSIRTQRAKRAAAFVRLAERANRSSESAARTSADLRGASSLTHTYALVSGAEEAKAAGYLELARLLSI